MRCALDAPTLLHIVERGATIHSAHQLVAPTRIRGDALELLLADVRAGARDEAEVRSLHDALTAVKIRALGDRVSRWRAWALAREHHWATLHDAEYLAVAQLQADALVTTDPGLAAKAEGLVELAPIEALGGA